LIVKLKKELACGELVRRASPRDRVSSRAGPALTRGEPACGEPAEPACGELAEPPKGHGVVSFSLPSTA